MATIISQLKGTAAEIAAKVLGNGVLAWNETTKQWHGGDGATAGGFPMAREDGKNDGALGYLQEVKTNDYAVLAADSGKMLVANKATAINFTLPAVASLTSKFVIGIKNVGAGPLSVTPNGAELIDGVNVAITIPTNASVVLKGDATSFRTYFSNGDVTGNAINNAATLTGVNLADNDKLGVFDVSAGALASLVISELIAGIFKTARKIANAYFLSSFRLWDATDNTKGVAFNLAGIATATTRTITMPDADVTLGTSINLAASVATSGTQIDFTSIPSTAKRVTLNLFGVSTNGNSDIVVQAGTSSGVEATGYAGSISRIGAVSVATVGVSSANFATVINNVAAAYLYHGKVVFEKVGGNQWTIEGFISTGNDNSTFQSSFSKTTAAALDRIRLSAGGNAFDSGSASISWET